MSDEQYRFRLTRDLRVGAGKAVWVMLNPSTADQRQDDPTIRRVKAFSARLGVRHIEVVNLYPHRATDPKQLLTLVPPDDVDDASRWRTRNRRTVQLAVQSADHVVFAWGGFYLPHYIAGRLPRPTNVIGETFRAGKTPVCLGVTGRGEPRHPLYVRSDFPFQPWPR
jgi:hypothetical protein